MVLGAHSIAGHMIASYLQKCTSYETLPAFSNTEKEQFLLDVAGLNQIIETVHQNKPDIVINCIDLFGDQAAIHSRNAIIVNSLLPHELVNQLDVYGGKLIHLSTDCVFNGNKGFYNETSHQDGVSIYGKTKVLGEINKEPHLTIRTSYIGPEQNDDKGLFQWFMNQQGRIKGFTHVKWNGVTTLELAKFIHHAIENYIEGLYHLTGPCILSNYDLFTLIKYIFQKDEIEIYPHLEPRIDRTLFNSRRNCSYKVPSYEKMLHDLRNWMDEPGLL
jgi:dTDP-4-dehydrorhamnose reductase